jgi:hypothetical protein
VLERPTANGIAVDVRVCYRLVIAPGELFLKLNCYGTFIYKQGHFDLVLSGIYACGRERRHTNPEERYET